MTLCCFVVLLLLLLLFLFLFYFNLFCIYFDVMCVFNRSNDHEFNPEDNKFIVLWLNYRCRDEVKSKEANAPVQDDDICTAVRNVRMIGISRIFIFTDHIAKNYDFNLFTTCICSLAVCLVKLCKKVIMNLQKQYKILKIFRKSSNENIILSICTFKFCFF